MDTLSSSETKPLRRLPDQPARHTASPVVLGDVEVADFGPARVPRKHRRVPDRLNFDVADLLAVNDAEKRVPFTPRDVRVDGQPGERAAFARSRRCSELGDINDLYAPTSLGEPCALEGGANVRPLLGNP